MHVFVSAERSVQAIGMCKRNLGQRSSSKEIANTSGPSQPLVVVWDYLLAAAVL
jgi:hypothetical protein